MDIFQEIHEDHVKVDHTFKTLLGQSGVGGRDAADELAGLLIPHAKAEEATVYPALQKHDEARDLVEESLQQHQQIAQKLNQLAKATSEDQVRAQLDQAQRVVHEHVKMEEDETFSAMRDLLSRDQLEELSRSFPIEKQNLQGQFRLAA